MKKLVYIITGIAVASTILFSSCNLADTNIDPTRQSDVNLNLILPSVLTQAAFNQASNPARVAGIIMQQLEGLDAQQLQYEDYVLPEITFNNFWRTGLYAAVLKDTKSVIEKAQAENEPYYEAVAKIIRANEYGIATSYFGDIPFSQALLGVDNLKPSYDSQEAVYQGVQALLDEAIALLSGNAGDNSLGGDDLVYAGDPDAWKAAAWALKARYHMHLSKRDANAAENVLNDLSNAFTSLADQPNFAFEDNQNANNPLAKFGVERGGTLGIDPNFVNDMITRNDPRVYYYADEGDSTQYYNGSNAQLVWARNDAVMPFISFVELKFLEAEAKLMNGAPDSEVAAALADAITASMDQIGIDPADYQAYVDANGTLDGLTTNEEKLEKLMTEAFYAMYGYGFQHIWSNYRRTGYPQLTPNPAGAGGLNPSGVIPRRYLYPSSEAQFNEDAWQAAVNNQNGALLDVDVWAFE